MMTGIIIISLISLLFDGVLTNYLPYLINDLTFFIPMFTVITIFLIYPLFYKEHKKYLIYTCILGGIYDLFYTNLFLFDTFLFLLLGLITIYIYKTFDVSKIRVLFHLIFIIALYEILFALCIKIFNLVPISIERLIYKITHSFLLNIIYGYIIHIIISKVAKKKLNYKIYKTN